LGELFRHFFGEFRFDGITLTPPTRTFRDRLELDVAGTAVELIEVGPAHTRGDVLVHVPSQRTVFTGDILFIGGTPIVWAGPISNWIAACDVILGLGVDTVVPGHGPVTDAAGVCQVRDYLGFIHDEARARFDAGMPSSEAAHDIALGSFGEWGEHGRIAVNVETAYREFDPGHRSPGVVELFTRMAAIEGWVPPV
jgi:cyclase